MSASKPMINSPSKARRTATFGGTEINSDYISANEQVGIYARGQGFCCIFEYTIYMVA
ncbi:hypothetical protein LG204_12765 [Methylovorus menthalis]|uniref:hypothetical protein n=1 Tax=Methylovorus menthalis TaxID=1002227 RepID=UPI001E49498C|nr:hypothetical protein [Methylovorus menthalis]MCB4812185.1 hypothetical protein [Methylovorus menthalis]